MPSPFIELERLTTSATLGLRFHDTISGVLVGTGLSVWAYPVNRPAARTPAISNRSGVYVLHHAAGLIDLEHVATSEWPPTPNSFIIEVIDDQRRFQPFQFTADLPVKDIYKWRGPNAASPPAPMSSIPLYSSPVRSVPSGMAVVRADLWNFATDTAAAWAVLEAYEGDRLIARGLADDQGRVALIFPYPQPASFAVGSPPGSPLGSPPGSPPRASGPPLIEQVWPLRLRVLYSPEPGNSSPPTAFESNQLLPDLRLTLSQSEATIWGDATGSEPLTEVFLRYGQELVLKSNSSPLSPLTPTRNSVLFISPAVSPP